MAGSIVIKGARVHNLKNIDLEIPRDRFVVITGVSGSGKSSLAFDTLYAEGQRRYLESLGADVRQLLKQLQRPDVDLIQGLSPAIAVQQKPGLANPRSTVGTITDIYDFMRLLFARVGQPYCVKCGREITARTVEQIVDHLLALPAQTRVMVLAPIEFSSRDRVAKGLEELTRQGFTRVIVEGEMHDLANVLPEAMRSATRFDLMVDRLVLREGVEKRLADSLEVASRASQQIIKIVVQDESKSPQPMLFSRKFACAHCGAAGPEITPELFSFNSPQGACPACSGLGASTRGAKRSKSSGGAAVCSTCNGGRLKEASLTVRVGGRTIVDLNSRSVTEVLEFLDRLEVVEERKLAAQKIITEIVSRLRCLAQLGLEYLSLDRASTTLSGGEAQRVRLATQVGSSLAGALYILDEPSIGLHQKDNERLIAILRQLRDAGNSVVVVEHDPETIMAADYVIDMGPGAGIQGGEVVARGVPADIKSDDNSLTGRYLRGTETVSVPPRRRAAQGFFTIKNARARNLKSITVQFPIGAMACVTGVSGAGKSTLVMEVLFDGVSRRLAGRRNRMIDAAEILGWEKFARVIAIDQSSIGRTPRSNPATYVGLHDQLRELFAQLPDAKVRGYDAKRFSFNARGGRCEACQGDGTLRVEMHFLADVYVTCEVCQGRRYNRETLGIRYKGLNIADILDLTVDQGLELLYSIPQIHDRLRTLRDVGLGYLRLGQPATTLSGGEAQRIKLARELARKSTGNSLYILDEPTTGLHFADVKKLLELLYSLIGLGNTMVIVEHNLEVIKCADYIIDLGPEGGIKGGNIIAQGTPEEICRTAGSVTGTYLSTVLAPAIH